MNRLHTRLGRIDMQNPITVASGTFSLESGAWYDLSKLGALVSKTITPEPREGNPPPRLFETQSGMLNSIGLQNPGLDGYLQEDLPRYAAIDAPLLVSFSASTIDEFCRMVEAMERHDGIDGYEVNVSCPNVEREGMAFGVDAGVVLELTQALAAITQRELCIKLTPNVTNIVDIAKAAKDGGATSLALINTLLGMAIDPLTGKSRIKRGVAGFSGPAIKPAAVACVWRVAQAVDLPILAMGGVASWLDALEFIRAGASAVAVGTAAFATPDLPVRIIDDLNTYCEDNQLMLADLIGKVTF